MNSKFLHAFSCTLLAALLAGTSLPAGAQLAQPLQPVDSVVAVVDEDVILRSELDRAVANILAQFADRRDQLPPQSALERQVLERLVLVRLQVQRAREGGVRISDAEVEEAIGRIAQQNNISLDQMRRQLAMDGIEFSEFAQSLREEIVVQRLRQSIVQSRVQVSESEIDILLASDSLQSGMVRAANILVALPDGATAEQLELARTKIDGVRALIDRGEMSFEAAAIRYSDAPNALEGGDLGWRRFDEVPPLFARMLEGMSTGEVSPAVRGPSGFHLLQLVERRDSGQQTVTEYSARHIMVRTTEIVSNERARDRARELKARLDGGADFAELARAESDDAMTRNAGGDMGWFPLYGWGQAVGDAVLSLEDGQVSQPFASEAGWHIVQRNGSREQDITERVRRDEAREAIGRRKAEDEYERFLRQLRDEAYVETRLAG
ncbi:MAG: peptidylprolyl isomerase [Aquimonas sp.]|nr:peptidylprolyl isomerase [Aquimonas sp.]